MKTNEKEIEFKLNHFASERENSFNRTFINDKPEGWVICDTVNNPFFPMDILPIDTGNFDLNKIKKEFHRKYGGRPNDLFLPWHYTIDVVNDFPYVIQSRPFNYKTFIPMYEKKLFIMIIGDSSRDIYNRNFYKAMAHQIINPFKLLHGFYILNQRKDFEFFTKGNFDITKLLSEVQ